MLPTLIIQIIPRWSLCASIEHVAFATKWAKTPPFPVSSNDCFIFVSRIENLLKIFCSGSWELSKLLIGAIRISWLLVLWILFVIEFLFFYDFTCQFMIPCFAVLFYVFLYGLMWYAIHDLCSVTAEMNPPMWTNNRLSLGQRVSCPRRVISISPSIQAELQRCI